MRKWLKRIGLGLLAVIVLGITGALVLIHTQPGRELERREIEAQLNSLFTGGGSVGAVQGTPFGELVIKDVVIRGADHKPAITVGEIRVRVHLFDLVHKDVSIGELLVSDIDVEFGKNTLATLMKPSPEPEKPESKSTWNIDFGGVALRRAHVKYDTNTPQYGVVDLDNLSITGNATLHSNGMRGGGIGLTAIWRQQHVPISIAALVKDDADHTVAPAVTVAIDGVSFAAHDLELVKQSMKFSGGLKLVAPKSEIAKLTGIELPDDVSLMVAATKDGHVSLGGLLGPTPIDATLVADVDAKHIAGKITTGDFDLAKLTKGGAHGSAGADIELDVAQGKPGELPTAHAIVKARASYDQLPKTDLVVAVDSRGQHASTTIDLHGAATAKIAAAVTRDGQSYSLDRASIMASAHDPVAQVKGSVTVNLVAHGPVWPRPSLTVVGAVQGKQLAAFGVSSSDVEVSLDTRGVPDAPKGTVHVHAFDVARGGTGYGKLAFDATSRNDGWLDVGLTSNAPQWIVELAARVKPPGNSGTTEIALEHHRVRTRSGADFSGNSGTIVIAPEQISVKSFKSSSKQGDISLDATYSKESGDVDATLDVGHVALASLKQAYAGDLAAHVAVQRKNGKLAAQLNIDGTGIALAPKVAPMELHAKLDAKPGHVALEGNFASAQIGKGALDVKLAAPQDLADVAAWQASGRNAIELAKIEMSNVDIARLATTLGAGDAKLSGKLGGKLELTATGADGTLKLRDLKSPALEGTGGIDADIAVTQPAADEVAPTIAVAAKQLGRVDAALDLKMPTKPFDPAAWQKLGTKALKSASVRANNLAFDPGLLKRFGLSSLLRGHATFDLEVAEALTSVKATFKIPDLRGSPLAKPVNTELEADIDGKTATMTLSLKTQQQVAMLNAKAEIPISLAQLRGDPKRLMTLPLTASVDIPQTSAPELMNVFGRSEIIAGNMSGKIEVSGTLGKPMGKVHLEADGLQVPPGPGGKPIKEVKQLAIDATWDGAKATLKIDGTEAAGGKLSVDAQVAPKQLAQGSAKITASGFDLVPVLAFAPGPAGGAAGQLDGAVTIKSFDPRSMQIGGKLSIKDARIPIAPEVGTLRDASVDITIEQHDLKLAANGRLGRGTLKADGTIALDKFSPTGGQATIVLKHVSPIGSVQPLIDAQITTKLAHKGEGWQADITIDHSFIKLDTQSGEKLKPVGAPSDLAFGAKPPPKLPPKEKQPGQTAKPQSSMFVANIKLQPTAVESDQVRTTVKGELHAVADLQGIDIKGKIETQGGDVELFDRRYRIEQAEVSFDGSTDPLLAVEISYDFPDVTLDAKINGRASKPQLQLTSNPGNYTQSQLLGFLLGGEPGGDTQSSSVADTATSAGESFIGAQLGNYVKKAIPGIKVDVLKYNAASATSSEAIEAGTWITHTLFFQLTEHPEARPDENNEEGTLEYWITHRLELQVTAGDRNYDGVDMLWRRRY